MAEAEQFAVALDAFVKKAKGRADTVVRKIVLDIGTRVVMRSPVGDPSLWEGPAPKGYTGGRFRANWQYGENAAPSGVLDERDPSGIQVVNRIASSIQPQAAGKVHFLTNNLPYAMRLETGWSQQAPQGMVGITVREYRSIVANAVKALS